MKTESREQIKDRLVRLAAEQWNLDENEIEANFDPLLILIFDAVAGEIEQIGYRIRDIQNNLLNKLSSLMLPQSLLNAKPASCVLTARPNGDTAILKSETNFSTTVRVSRADEVAKDADINFTPIGETKLINVQLSHIRIGGKLYRCDNSGKKTLIHDEGNNLMSHEIHFALQTNGSVNSLAGLQFFFDLKGHSEAHNFYFTLRETQLLINGNPTPIDMGYYKNTQYEATLKDVFNKDSDYSLKLQRETAAIYRNQFITIDESADPISTNTTPHPLLENLPEKLQQEIHTPNVVYGTFQLGRPFAPEVTERLQIVANAFPAINRKLEKIYHKTEKWLNIIPLLIHGSYLDIHSIEGSNGMKYRLQSAHYDNKVEEGEAIIRAARISKSSSADIRNALKSLTEAIRDESAYFSRISNDFISSRLNEISRILRRLEDQIQLSKDEKPSFRYVLLRSKNPGETVQVSYWNTSPREAGFVKAHLQFRPFQHSLTEVSSCYSVTTAIGGRETLSDYAQKQMLVRQLTSKGKIISVEDIRLLCFELFGPQLKKVAVQKSMHVLPGKNSGFSRFIDIQLYLSKHNFSDNEVAYLEKQLRYQLETEGCFAYPFTITIKETKE